MEPALVWNRGREEDARGEPNHGSDEASGGSLRKVLGDLERDREVKAAVHSKRLVEARRQELALRNVQAIAGYPVAVDAEVVADTVSLEDLEPDPAPAAKVDDTPW